MIDKLEAMDKLADLLDDLIRAQDVNQAGFYSTPENERRAAYRACVDHYASLLSLLDPKEATP